MLRRAIAKAVVTITFTRCSNKIIANITLQHLRHRLTAQSRFYGKVGISVLAVFIRSVKNLPILQLAIACKTDTSSTDTA